MSARYVYRCVDASGRLLYVGCTADLAARLKAHAVDSFWARSVARVNARIFATAEAGLAAERRIIREENPRFNLTGRWQHHASWSLADFDDYIMACEQREQRQWPSEWRTEHLRRVRQVRDFLARSVMASDAWATTEAMSRVAS